jgi:D-sedoheptulose 7-phosphate isomerase
MINKILNNEFKNITKCLSNIKKQHNQLFIQLCDDALLALKNGGKIILCGNGGSAADAQHLATELVVRYKKNRKPISAISLATDTSILTAVSNDFSFDKVFSRQIEALANKKDLIICLSTSANSKNIINAVVMAKKLKVKCYSIVGNKGGKLKKIQKELIIIPEKKTSVIQTCQLTLGHIFCEYIEKKLT